MDTANSSSARPALERLPSVLSRTGMGRSWIYREISAQRFPSPIHVGGASCWNSREIDAWIEAQLRSAEPRK